MKLLPKVVLLIVVLGAGLWGIINYQLPSYDRPKATIEGLGAPPLPAGFTILEGDINQEDGKVLVSVVWDYNAVGPDKAVGVYLSLYDWGKEHVSAGGDVDIILLIADTDYVLTVDGLARYYYVMFEGSLEKSQIDRVLRQPPIDMDRLAQIHIDIAKATNEAGARLFAPDPFTVVYTGLHTYYEEAN